MFYSALVAFPIVEKKVLVASNLKKFKKMEPFFGNVLLLLFSLNPVAKEKE